MTPIRLMVGLGNPGAKYATTRHNAGVWFFEALLNTFPYTLKTEGKFHGQHALVTLFGQECHLLLPTTYMNDSGLSVRATANYYKIPPEAILIVHDEIDLPVGSARLKFDGGAGGHNGLKDIIEQLHTKKFYRLRLGVGHPGNSRIVVDYVLNAPSKAERSLIDSTIQQAQAVLPAILAGNVSAAMQQLHSQQQTK